MGAVTAGGCIILEVRKVLLVALRMPLVLGDYDTDISNRLMNAFSLPALHDTIPNLDQFFHPFLIPIAPADSLHSLPILLSKGKQDLFELPHFDGLLFDHSP
jgi:hypothetical protein